MMKKCDGNHALTEPCEDPDCWHDKPDQPIVIGPGKNSLAAMGFSEVVSEQLSDVTWKFGDQKRVSVHAPDTATISLPKPEIWDGAIFGSQAPRDERGYPIPIYKQPTEPAGELQGFIGFRGPEPAVRREPSRPGECARCAASDAVYMPGLKGWLCLPCQKKLGVVERARDRRDLALDAAQLVVERFRSRPWFVRVGIIDELKFGWARTWVPVIVLTVKNEAIADPELSAWNRCRGFEVRVEREVAYGVLLKKPRDDAADAAALSRLGSSEVRNVDGITKDWDWQPVKPPAKKEGP